MTNQSLESAQSVSGTPTPNGVQGAGSGQATSPDIGAVLAELDNLKKQVTGLQSIGDKRQAKLEEKYSVIEDYVKRAGGQVDPRVIRDMQVDEILANRNSPQTVSPGSGAPLQTPQPAAIDYLAPLKAVGLDANDSEVLGLMVKHNGDQTAFNASLVDLKAKRLNQPPASASAIPAPSGGMGSGDDNQKAQTLISEIKQLRTNPTSNRKRLAEANAELRALTS